MGDLVLVRNVFLQTFGHKTFSYGVRFFPALSHKRSFSVQATFSPGIFFNHNPTPPPPPLKSQMFGSLGSLRAFPSNMISLGYFNIYDLIISFYLVNV